MQLVDNFTAAHIHQPRDIIHGLTSLQRIQQVDQDLLTLANYRVVELAKALHGFFRHRGNVWAADDNDCIGQLEPDFAGDLGGAPHPDREHGDPDISWPVLHHLLHDLFYAEIENIALDDARLVVVPSNLGGQVQQAQRGRLIGNQLDELVAPGDPLVRWRDQGDFSVAAVG